MSLESGRMGHSRENADSLFSDEAFEAERDPSESLSIAIVRAVSAVTGKSSLDLQLLQTVMDVDALEQIFQHNSRTSESITLRFDYEGCRVWTDGSVIRLDQKTTDSTAD